MTSSNYSSAHLTEWVWLGLFVVAGGCVSVVEGGFVLGAAVLLLLLFGAVVAEVVFTWVLASGTEV